MTRQAPVPSHRHRARRIPEIGGPHKGSHLQCDHHHAHLDRRTDLSPRRDILTDYRQRLLNKLEHGQVVAVVGAGVSMAITGNAPTANWVGLIRHGINYAAPFTSMDRWSELKKSSLDSALQANNTQELVLTATSIASQLKNHPQRYTDWLREAIGELPVEHEDVAHALAALQIPILTTNYDTLLEKVLRLEAVSWKETEAMRELFNNSTSRTIGHMHGIWDDPSSVILSESDYARLTLTESAQFLQQSQYASKSFLFVGCGEGLADPNFTNMLKLHREMFPESRGDHFRLCLSSELPTIEANHLDDDIRVISYGESFEDLPAFLTDLATATSTTTRAPVRRIDGVAFAKAALLEEIADSNVTRRSKKDGTEDLDDFLIPPLLLPMSHEQFASMKSKQAETDSDTLDTLDPHEVATDETPDVIVVVGGEHSGVTTALQWLLATNTQDSDNRSPLYVDAQTCPSDARQPFIRKLSHAARASRLIDRLEDPLPPCAFALDNLVYRPTAFTSKILDDVADLEAPYKLVGCRPEDEPMIVKSLEERGLTIKTVHMGKLTKNEVTKFVSIIAPSTHVETTSEAVLEIAKREHLPRNPFTISLLISLVSELGQRDERYDSETVVLDEYTKLLLGMFSDRNDSRFTLSYQDKGTILSHLAKEYVASRRGSLRNSRVLEIIEDTFDALSWKEDPDKCLASFYKARVLRKDGDQVRFQQSSYLYLFAAKAALSDSDFKDSIFEEPLFFAPIIKHYAALKGDSVEAVTKIGKLLDEWDDYRAQGSIYGAIEVSTYSDDDLDDPDKLDEGRPAEQRDIDRKTGKEAEADLVPYDTSDDSDHAPFPLDDLEDLSGSALLGRRVDLASRVLRDSVSLANKELKADTLLKILHSWAVLIELLEIEGEFASVVSLIVENNEELHSLSDDKKSEIVERANLLLPSLYVMAGMNVCLTSRKLLITLENLMTDESFFDRDFAPIGAVLYALLLHEENWAAGLPRLLQAHGDKWIVSGFISLMAQITHRTEALAANDESLVKQFIIGAETRKRAFATDSQRKVYIASLNQRLDRARRLSRRERLVAGVSASSRLVEGTD
ncbi:hypothetical protein BN1051_02877 [Arthrobacter saudimassiliensis]|uniref:Uncharacterized protein n=1 Tax=Arthrobacter saudimassiliensis TaxID=1461584 RepID=A0A078MVQ5_9MICC|nr:hypothetical protein BN1051_02877 [Arthrobacter saudimassiliensis]